MNEKTKQDQETSEYLRQQLQEAHELSAIFVTVRWLLLIWFLMDLLFMIGLMLRV